MRCLTILSLLFFALPAQAGDFTVTSTQCICDSGSDGAITLEVSNTTETFTYEWQGPDGYLSNNQNPDDIILPGEYFLYVTNSSGCTIMTDLMVEIEQCASYEYLTLEGGAACSSEADGEIHSQIAGGTGELTYEWSNGSSETELFNLLPDMYSLTVIDENGCTIERELNLPDPADFSASLDVSQDCLCPESASFPFQLTTAGASASDYTFAWSGPSGFVSNSPSPAITLAGAYSVTVTDPAHCETIFTTDEMETCPAITLGSFLAKAPTNCGETDGLIRPLSTTTGVAPLILTLFDKEGNIMQNTPYGWPYLSGGIYTLRITDGNGCSITEVFPLIPEDGILLSGGVQHLCYGEQTGEVFALGSSSLGQTLRYVWSTGDVFMPEDQGEPVALSGLSAGEYCVTVSYADGSHPDCTVNKCFTIESLESTAPLSFTNIDFTPSICPDEPNSGYMSVNVTGGVPDPDYGYDYEWNFNEVGNTAYDLPVGEYCVTVTDYCGASISTCREIISDDDFEITISGGLFMAGDESSPMVGFIQIGNDPTFSTVFPEDYEVYWGMNGTVVESNTNPFIVSVSDVTGIRTVSLRVVKGCITKRIQKDIYICGEENASAFFITDEFRPCLGGSNGEIHLSIPNIFGADVAVFYGDNAEELELTTMLNLDMTATQTGLETGTHSFTVIIDDCEVTFDYELLLADPTTEFVEYEPATHNCIYQDFCGNTPLGQFATESWLDPMNGTKNPCVVPEMCGNMWVFEKPYQKRTCRGLEYRGLVTQMSTNGNFVEAPFFSSYLTDMLSGGFTDCHYVKYCTGNMKRISRWGFGGSATFSHINNNGCAKYTCGGFLEPNITVCPDEECAGFPNYTFDVEPPQANTCEEYGSFSLFGLWYAYEQGWLNGASGFVGSSLHDLLESISLMTDEERAPITCAIAIFCKDNYELLYHNMWGQDCDIIKIQTPIFDPLEEAPTTPQAWSALALAGVGFNLDFEETEFESCLATPITAENEVIGHTLICETEACEDTNTSYADCLNTILIYYEELFDIFGVDPFVAPAPQGLAQFNDQFGLEKVSKVSTLTYQGYTIPKAILSTPQGRVYYDFTPGYGIESKDLVEGLEYQIENWDNETSLMVLSNDQGGYRFVYESPLQTWDKILYATPGSSFDLESVAVNDLTGDVEIMGLTDGDLFLMNDQLLSGSDSKLFSVKVSTEGTLINMSVVSGVNESMINGSSFNLEGDYLLVSEFATGGESISFEGQPMVAGIVQEGIREGVMSFFDVGESEFANPKRIGFEGESAIMKSASNSIGKSAFLVGKSNATESSAYYDLLFKEDDSKTLLAAVNPDGEMAWETLINGTDFPLSDIVFLPEDEVFVALTFSNTFQVGSQTFQSEGGYDVALLRFSGTGDLIWSETYGTIADELVQQLYFNGQEMFFIGELWGDVIQRTLGERTFVDYTPYTNEVYISYIHLNDNNTALNAAENSNLIVPIDQLKEIENDGMVLEELYPNPSNSNVYLDISIIEDDAVIVTLETPFGEEIAIWEYEVSVGKNTLSLDIPDIPDGLYIISILSKSTNETITTKFVRQ